MYYHKHQFCDLDGDGIVELIIYRKFAYNNIYIDRVLTIENGSVVPFDLSTYGSVDSTKFNTVFGNRLESDYRTGGTRDEVFYALTDGRVARVSYHWGSQDGIVVYDFNNKTITNNGNVLSMIGTLPGTLIDKSNYGNKGINLDHVSNKTLSEMDYSKLKEELDKENKSLIRHDDGTYSSVSKEEAQKYYDNYAKEIFSDREKRDKYSDQIAQDQREGYNIVVTDEMKKLVYFHLLRGK